MNYTTLQKLHRMAQAFELKQAENRKNRAPANRLYVGERGGRYYKRTRADGTTYRDYTW